MGTISDKLMRVINTKEDIRQALIFKGYDVPTSIPFKEYAKMILDLPCRVGSFPDIEGIVARYSALGLTNEQMAENPIWKDLTGNGHDLQMKNFAWKGMSGVGGYTENYDSDSWYKVSLRIDVTWTYKSFNVKSIKDNNAAQLFYQSRPSDTGFRVLPCTIKVSGLTDGQGIEYISNGTQPNVITRPIVIMRIENDGIYHLPSFDFGAKNAYYGFKFLKLQESCNITIEQPPLYPGALVFDGVDDYGTCNNFPILTKEKGYTVVALRQWLSFRDIGYPTLVVNSTDRLAAFSFENFISKTKSTWNWGRSAELSDYKIPLLYTYQTSTSYNSKTIYAGATEEGSNILQVCRSGIYCANAAIWEIVILDHDATEEELTKIKNYFVKTYPWLFPDQAWTVTGKTNEDEDRATIANITGNGNDLVLSNFGFAEGSGYGLYAYNFNSFNLRDNVVKPTDVKKDSFRIIGTGDNSNVLVLSNTSNSADWKIRITGMKEGDRCLIGNENKSGEYISVNKDGTYTFQKQYAATSTNGIWYNSSQEVDVLVEQIPEYEGYLITDGVDDKVTSVNAVTLNKDFTVVGEWRFKETEIRSNCGIVVERVLFVYNIPTGIRIYIHEVGGNFTELQNIKSLKAICSNGIVYDENWNPISVKVGSLEEYSNKLLLGYLSNSFTQIAFKNMSIYSNQVLSKDDCIKAYNYLQTLKSK